MNYKWPNNNKYKIELKKVASLHDILVLLILYHFLNNWMAMKIKVYILWAVSVQ